jgi:hypothetical protein
MSMSKIYDAELNSRMQEYIAIAHENVSDASRNARKERQTKRRSVDGFSKRSKRKRI